MTENKVSGVKVKLQNVSKTFKKSTVINNLNLSINPGEFLVLLGPSGCGKSTTLRLIAGLDQPTQGKILFDGKNVKNMTSEQRKIAMVFQDYALYPNMTVYQNLDYALRVHKVKKAVRKQRLERILQTLNLKKVENHYPNQLSGGQKQRTALGRGMAKKSRLFLLDEPLSNIDVQLREKARDEIQKIHEINQQTIIYVTHDQTEAMALGDRIAVMNDGQIQMIAVPDEIYNHPTNLFVAQFIGSPRINLLPVNVVSNSLQITGQIAVTDWHLLTKAKLQQNDQLLLGVRPENVKIEPIQPASYNKNLLGKIVQIIDYGRFQQLSIEIAANQLLKAVVNRNTVKLNTTVAISFVQDKCLLFDLQTKKNINWRG
mgnify:CR=1 FL=1